MGLDTSIASLDSDLFNAITQEQERQEAHLELIASENYASSAVMAVQGSVLTNKYAEGYSGKRYYGGCEFVDLAENLAIARVKELFGADYANVQPHSGSSANLAVFMALLQPGDTVLGMDLNAGGHLTHGCKVNFSGLLYQSVVYGVDSKTGLIDMDEVRQLAHEHKPKLLIAGFSAYSRVVDWAAFKEIAEEVGAYLMVDMAHVAGLVAAGHYPNPLPYADVVTSTTHKTLRGPRGGIILAKSNPEIEKKLNSRVFPGTQGGPLMHVIAAKAMAFHEALGPDFKAYQRQVIDNAKAMGEALMGRGMDLVSGGTDNHLFLVDLTKQDITGKDAEHALELAQITVNKNTVPGEKRSPFVTSGLRIGTPAMTTRGMGIEEAKQIGHWIADILCDLSNESLISATKAKVNELCHQFPVYQKENQ